MAVEKHGTCPTHAASPPYRPSAPAAPAPRPPPLGVAPFARRPAGPRQRLRRWLEHTHTHTRTHLQQKETIIANELNQAAIDEPDTDN